MKNISYTIIVIFMFLFSVESTAQGFAFDLGYKTMKGSYMQAGVSYRISDHTDENVWNVDAALLTDFNRHHIPKIGVQKRLVLFELGGNISTRYAEPTLGFNLLNALKLNAGYTFPYKNDFPQQFTFGLVISLGGNRYYDRLNFM
ncbi:MAG: hypothetical protein Q4G08_00330 [Capnocytophaga sp.]|nr:hypothetical protein [Capnocytophaga sp.]